MGIAVAHTSLDNRQVIHRCRELLQEGKVRFDFAVKWVPVDYWCWTDLESIKQLIDEKVLPLIQPEETWAMQVNKRRWQTYHTIDIVGFATVAAGLVYADLSRNGGLTADPQTTFLEVILWV